MMIKDILNYNDAIKDIIDNTKNVNALVKFRLLGMCKQFEPIVSNYDVIYNEKIKQYGTVVDDRVGIIQPDRNKYSNEEEYNKAVEAYESSYKKFVDDMDQVLNSEANINIQKFKYTDIIDAGLPSEYLIAIYDLIEEWLGGIE